MFDSKLKNIYDKNEAMAIAKIYFMDELALSSVDIALDKPITYNKAKFENDLQKLHNQEPVQYITGKCKFLDLDFMVNHYTLIPRPETEELVLRITKDFKNSNLLKVLDVGTGSGCIPISLKNLNPDWTVSALDISDDVLEMAKINAEKLKAKIAFFLYDILNRTSNIDTVFDCIISNPPYVLESEKVAIHSNVLNYEPHLALFVPDENPLLFYKAILEFCESNLKLNGSIYFEINPLKATEMHELLKEFDYSNIELIKDFNNKIRFVTGIKS